MEFEDTFYGRPNTITTYRSLFRRHIKMEDVHPEFDKWSDDMTRLMLSSWDKKGLARNTKITLMRLLGRYVTFKGGPNIDTQKYIRSLQRSEQQTEVTALNSTQAARLMAEARRLEPKFYPVLLLALHGGLRRGEIFGLRCSDVDMLKGRIKVAHSYDGPTKSGRTRYVPLSPELSKALTSARNLLLRDPESKVFEQFDPNPVLRRLCGHAGLESGESRGHRSPNHVGIGDVGVNTDLSARWPAKTTTPPIQTTSDGKSPVHRMCPFSHST